MTTERKFILAQFNGNTGYNEAFETLEKAIGEGECIWSRKTDTERRTYTEKGYFVVFEGDEDDTEWTAIKDWTEARIDDWSGTVKVTTTGNSVILKITDAARAMGLERGDFVDVTIRRNP